MKEIIGIAAFWIGILALFIGLIIFLDWATPEQRSEVYGDMICLTQKPALAWNASKTCYKMK